jgi:hypothetical protein
MPASSQDSKKKGFHGHWAWKAVGLVVAGEMALHVFRREFHSGLEPHSQQKTPFQSVVAAVAVAAAET